MGLFPKIWENNGVIFPKLGNVPTCYSQFWEIKETRNPCIGKGLVKVWVTFSHCWVQFGKKMHTYFKIPTSGIQWVFFPKIRENNEAIFFPSWETFQYITPNFGKLKG